MISKFIVSGAFWDEVRHCFLQQFDFSGVPLDYSLRYILNIFMSIPLYQNALHEIAYATRRPAD
jgi:hypothetical protein